MRDAVPRGERSAANFPCYSLIQAICGPFERSILPDHKLESPVFRAVCCCSSYTGPTKNRETGAGKQGMMPQKTGFPVPNRARTAPGWRPKPGPEPIFCGPRGASCGNFRRFCGNGERFCGEWASITGTEAAHCGQHAAICGKKRPQCEPFASSSVDLRIRHSSASGHRRSGPVSASLAIGRLFDD